MNSTPAKPVSIKRKKPSSEPTNNVVEPVSTTDTKSVKVSKPKLNNTEKHDHNIELLIKNFNLDLQAVQAVLKDSLPSTSRYRKAKKPRVEGLPKRALSSYMFFTKEHRDTVKNELVDGKPRAFTAITKELGTRWGSLDEAAKKKYQDLALIDKTRYTNAMIAFNKEHNISTEPAPKKIRAKKAKTTTESAEKGAAIEAVIAALPATDQPVVPAKPKETKPRAPKAKKAVEAAA